MKNNTGHNTSRPVAIWLLIGVCMIIIQILLGGVTRLTGSGLSITEWNVVTGTLPPLNNQQWMIEFQKYQQTPQFQLLNFDFTLKDFKFIFFWEWFHRFWARLIGVVFIVPFIFFLFKRRFKPLMIKPLIILFLLGALQGAIGWIMVASGLSGDTIYVKPLKLALHFILALVLLCYTFWFALMLLVKKEELIVNRPVRKMTAVVTGVLIIQLFYGALMAGHKAATAAPTWPDINRAWIPGNMMRNNEGLLNLIDNVITLHFIHRGLAYLLFILTIVLTLRLYKTTGGILYKKTRLIPFFLIIIQIVLGVITVLSSTAIIPGTWGLFEWMAQLHQLTGMLFLLSLIWILYIVRGSNKIISI